MKTDWNHHPSPLDSIPRSRLLRPTTNLNAFPELLSSLYIPNLSAGSVCGAFEQHKGEFIHGRPSRLYISFDAELQRQQTVHLPLSSPTETAFLVIEFRV